MKSSLLGWRLLLEPVLCLRKFKGFKKTYMTLLINCFSSQKHFGLDPDPDWDSAAALVGSLLGFSNNLGRILIGIQQQP